MSTESALTVIAHLKAKPGCDAALRDALTRIAILTRAEVGCRTYDLHVSDVDPRHFVVYEEWTNDAALADHFEEEYLKTFVEEVDDIIVEPVLLEKLRPIRE